MSADDRYGSTIRIDLLLNSQDDAEQSSQPPSDNSRMETLSPAIPTSDFDVLLQSIYDAALLTDFSGNIINANERALRFFIYTEDSITRYSISDLIAGADTDILETVIENVQSERFTLLQAHCIRSDQSLFPAEIAVTCLTLTDATSLCFFIRDISIRRQTEAQLRIEHNAIQNAGSGIAITDPNGIISYANPTMCDLWKRDSNAAFHATPIQDLFYEGNRVVDVISKAASDGTWNGELKACPQDKQPFFVIASVTRGTDEDGAITHFVFSFVDTTQRRLDEEALRLYQDHLEDLIRERTAELETINNDLKSEIAERQRVEEDLRDAIQKLREHDQAKNMFVSNVSHELRTPLTALIHATENLLRGVTGPVPDGIRSYLSMMLEDCWRLDRTVCDILDLSRIEAGKIRLSRTNIPFRHLVIRTVESLRMEAESVPLTLDVVANGDNGFVECDAAKMERVIINILNNAIKFTPPGGIISVNVAQQVRDGTAGISCTITDTGVGIPETYINRVTERFFRVGEQVGGTGLGLAIAKEIVERHSGALEITSPPAESAKGTEVTLWLPTTAPQQVMIVASDASICKQLRPALTTRGYQTSSYQSANDALQSMHDHKHHIVIVDSSLLDMDGSEIVMHMKADPILRHTPVFLLADAHPGGTRSSILSCFDIPVYLKTEGMRALIAAVQNIFFSKPVGGPEFSSA